MYNQMNTMRYSGYPNYNQPSNMTAPLANMSQSGYNKFVGYIQDGMIYTDTNEGPQQVGVILSTHNEAVELLNSYQAKLIELGEIEEPLTSEQKQEKLLNELMVELKESKETNKKLMSFVDTFIASKGDTDGFKEPILGSSDRDITDAINSAIGK